MRTSDRSIAHGLISYPPPPPTTIPFLSLQVKLLFKVRKDNLRAYVSMLTSFVVIGGFITFRLLRMGYLARIIIFAA